jgi:hypothetical protein
MREGFEHCANVTSYEQKPSKIMNDLIWSGCHSIGWSMTSTEKIYHVPGLKKNQKTWPCFIDLHGDTLWYNDVVLLFYFVSIEYVLTISNLFKAFPYDNVLFCVPLRFWFALKLWCSFI